MMLMTIFLNSNTNLIFGLLCLKNCRNFGIKTLRGCWATSESSISEESSQIFCSAPNAPYIQYRCR